MAHFDRERIPERVVHAKGAGAFGYFEVISILYIFSVSSTLLSFYLFLYIYYLSIKVTHDISKYCKASVFDQVGKQTPIAVRFSTVGGESGSADTARYKERQRETKRQIQIYIERENESAVIFSTVSGECSSADTVRYKERHRD